MNISDKMNISRRHFVLGASSTLLLAALPFSKNILAQAISNNLTLLSGNVFDLTIDYKTVNMTGKKRTATVVNGTLPGPVLRWKEGETLTLRVTNNLDVDSSIHWHGLILPMEMDGVPGISFDGIKPGTTFVYKFKVQQSGTFWYHSHSGFQEQTGLYGAIVIEPKDPDPVAYDSEHVIMLSDWSDEAPEAIYAKLKKQPDYYNFRERTAGDFFTEVRSKGLVQAWKDRSMWNNARMTDRDISDVTAYTYTYLVNGNPPEQGWQGLFKPGEKVRLRFVNSAAMTIFDVRIPGLKMTVVTTDGQNVQPVTVDEFRIGVAETYDVIVEPQATQAYCIFAQSIERSGYARGNLTPDLNMQAAVPAMDPPPVLGHRDMGMSMAAMGHDMSNMQGMDMGNMSGMDHDMSKMQGMDNMSGMDHDMSKMQGMDMDNMSGMDHDMSKMQGMDMGDMSGMDHDMSKMQGMDMDNMSGMDHDMDNMSGMDMSQMSGMVDGAPVASIGLAGFGSNNEIKHLDTEFGPHVDMRADAPRNGLNDPGIGLRDNQRLYGRKVLTYGDLRGLQPTIDKRQPSREIQLHLTGNMHRYMWSMNGIKFADAPPLELKYGERVRITFINDTMMTHPMHLHGMWSELETGDPDFMPRKHTVLVQPGSKISYLVTADAKGSWAYHCHLIFHMPGMFRKVVVS